MHWRKNFTNGITVFASLLALPWRGLLTLAGRFAFSSDLLFCMLLLLTACSTPSRGLDSPLSVQAAQVPPTHPAPSPALPPTQTVTPSPEPSATPTSTLTPIPTVTPTMTVVPLAVDHLPVIAPENAARLTRLVRIVRPAGQIGFALSPDGKMLAFGFGQAVRLWNIRQGQVIRELLPPSSYSAATVGGAMAFSPDGTHLARVYAPDRIIAWSTQTGEVTMEISGPSFTQALAGLAYAGRGKALRLVASGLVSGQPGMFFWDAATGDLLSARPSGDTVVSGFVVSPNGNLVVQAGQDGVVRFWNSLTGQQAGQQILYACPDSLLNARFNGSGGLLALTCDGASDTQAKLQIFFYSPNYYRPDAMSLFKVFRSNSASSGLVAFTADSSLLAITSGNVQIGSRANQLELWNFYTQHREATFSLIIQDILQIEFTHDGKLMILALSDGSIEIWGIQPVQS